jgi:hypothetical protein
MPIMQDGLITAARAHDQADRKVRGLHLRGGLHPDKEN